MSTAFQVKNLLSYGTTINDLGGRENRVKKISKAILQEKKGFREEEKKFASDIFSAPQIINGRTLI